MFNVKKYNKAYYLVNCEKIKEQVKKYYSANREKMKENSRKWRLANPEKVKASRKKHAILDSEKIKERAKKWRLANLERAKTNAKEWKLSHPEQAKELQRKWRQTPVGKKCLRKAEARRRQFECVPLNKPFDCAEGHHIDKQFVIYIPTEMHEYNRHSVTQDKGMDLINTLAFNWLEAEELYTNYVR